MPPRKNNNSTTRRTPRPKPEAEMDVNIADLEPKNVDLLRRYVTDEGRILPRKYTGFPAGHQRQLTRAIKRARQMLLMK